jgi:hypothetical protein
VPASTSGLTRRLIGGVLAEFAGDAIQTLQLAFRFDVEAMDARLKRGTHLGRSLADAGKQHLRRVAAGGEDARQLAAGDDVEARAEAREAVEQRQAGVGLDGIADQVGVSGKRRVIGAVGGIQGSAGVDIAGCAEAFGNGVEGDGFAMQPVIDAREEGHLLSVLAEDLAGSAGLGRYKLPFLPQPESSMNRAVRMKSERMSLADNMMTTSLSRRGNR